MKNLSSLLKWKPFKITTFSSLFVLMIYSNNHLMAVSNLEYLFADKINENEAIFCISLTGIEPIGGEMMEPPNENENGWMAEIKFKFIESKNAIDEKIQEFINRKELSNKTKIGILLSLIFVIILGVYSISEFTNKQEH